MINFRESNRTHRHMLQQTVILPQGGRSRPLDQLNTTCSDRRHSTTFACTNAYDISGRPAQRVTAAEACITARMHGCYCATRALIWTSSKRPPTLSDLFPYSPRRCHLPRRRCRRQNSHRLVLFFCPGYPIATRALKQLSKCSWAFICW
jgi:hypothetical protein